MKELVQERCKLKAVVVMLELRLAVTAWKELPDCRHMTGTEVFFVPKTIKRSQPKGHFPFNTEEANVDTSLLPPSPSSSMS